MMMLEVEHKTKLQAIGKVVMFRQREFFFFNEA